MNAEYQKDKGCPQRDSAEHEGYVGVQSTGGQEGKEQDGADLLERILDRGNLNKAYKRVKANKGAPGIDGMSIEEALPWLRKNREELLESIRQGKYKPQPVRRKEIPKPDGGVRQLGIPTVIDRIIQQAIAQQLVPIYEPLFSGDSYGYRPKRSAQQAITRVKEYAEQGYTQAVLVDLSKYFDTLNHELLMNLLRKNVHDKRVIDMIKKYLKAGVMENGLLVKTEEGSPQGGPLSPLLANIYLNEYDQEMKRRGVPVVRYADDIVVLAKSSRAAQRLLETTQRYLEKKLKLRMNVEKSKVVSVYSIQNFKFLGFALGKGKNGVYIRAHAKSLKKARAKLKKLTSRSQGRNVRKVMENVKVYIRGWLGYRHLSESGESMTRNVANYMLVNRYIDRGDLEQAQDVLDSMPDRNTVIEDYADKLMLQVKIYMKQDRAADAAKELEQALLTGINKVQMYLLKLADAELAAGEPDKSKHIAQVHQDMVKLFELWECSAFAAALSLAME